MRFLCLHVPAFPLAALLRAEPDLHGVALAVADAPGPRARVLAVSPEAECSGIAVGLTTAQAQSRLSGLEVRAVSTDLLRAAQAALCDAAESFSPRVEDAGEGLVYLDVSGLQSLFASEHELAHAAARRTEALGLPGRVGIGGSKVAARLAARDGGGVAVIPPGEEWSFLAPVPVDLLEPSRELGETLRRWGIRTIGDLAALPAAAVATRLGPEGKRLVDLARGEDPCPLQPRPAPLHFEEGIDIDYGIESVEPFLFVLRGLLDRLIARLEVRGLVCGDLRLSLQLATCGRDERTVAVAAPSNDRKALLMLVRLNLENHPPGAAVDGVRLLAVPERLRPAQLDLFRPSGPAPARLATTLARLTAICGADRVGAPQEAKDHRPDGYGVGEFVVREAETRFLSPASGTVGVSRNGLVTARNPLSIPSPAFPRERAQGEGSCCALALRVFRPPREVEVLCQRDRPQLVRGDGVAGRVVHAAGPWRHQGSWWNEARYARDSYDVQLSDGGVYRIYCQLDTLQWYLEGSYD